MSGHKQWSEIRHKSKATIPDINQVREALDAFARANATSTKLGLAPRAVPRPVVIAVAWAFVEGDLIPAEVDIEAAAIRRDDNGRLPRQGFAAAAEVLRIRLSTNGFKMKDAKVRAGHWIPDIIGAYVDAALAAFQESGEK